MQYEHKMSPFLWLRFEQGDSINGAPDHWRPPIATLEKLGHCVCRVASHPRRKRYKQNDVSCQDVYRDV